MLKRTRERVSYARPHRVSRYLLLTCFGAEQIAGLATDGSTDFVVTMLSGAGTSTTRGSAFHLNPLNILSWRPSPRSPPEQLRSLLMQLLVQTFNALSSQAPNQSAWNDEPGVIMGMPGITSELRCQVGRLGLHEPDRSRSASTLYHTPMVNPGITLGCVVGHLRYPQSP